jgi:hypothetical protein
MAPIDAALLFAWPYAKRAKAGTATDAKAEL